MLNASQIAWAASHDWFCEAYDGWISVWDMWTDRGTLHRKLVYFHDFQALRDWAGY